MQAFADSGLLLILGLTVLPLLYSCPPWSGRSAGWGVRAFMLAALSRGYGSSRMHPVRCHQHRRAFVEIPLRC